MSIEQRTFGTMPDNTKISLYILKNKSGAFIECMEYGARVNGIWIPDKKGTIENVVLAHDTLEEYFNDCFGATVGRYANRLNAGQFTIDGKIYQVNKNENGNTLHGGLVGFHKRAWRMKCCDNSDDAPSITFALHSENGEEGFPGNVDVSVKYTLSTDNALIIDYTAKTDAPTVVNLTNHTFFNLSGNDKRDILLHELQIEADSYTEATAELIPTGKLIPANGTPFDFRKAKTIGQDIHAKDILLQKCGGYDHNFALNGDGMRKAADVLDTASGRRMLVFTDLPGMQLYTANHFANDVYGQNHKKLEKHHALCLETQFFPDAPNHNHFASPILRPGELYKHTTTYKFELV